MVAEALGRTHAQKSCFSSLAEFKFQIFGIGPPRIGRQASRILHPFSPFAQGLTIVTTAALLYTAIVVPVTVGFFWNESECYRMPTFEIDLAVDSFFLLQVIITFFIGVYKKGIYYDDLGFVADNYIKGTLAFDVVTSVPVSYIDAWVLSSAQCTSSGENMDTTFNASSLRLLRILKPLRIFKMIRILKLIRVLHVFDAIEKLFRPPPLLFRVFRVLAGIAFLVHACACTYWLVKTISSDEDEVFVFLEGMNLPRDASLAQRYILSQYFVNTVFTTVGFGDIAAESTAEQVYCIVIMYCGTIVFGVLLSEIESAVSSMRAFPREKGRTIQRLMDFLKEQDVPMTVQKQVLSWVEFDTTAEHEDLIRQKALRSVPDELRKILVGQLHHDELDKIPLFQSLTCSCRERLLVDLWDKMESTRVFQSLPIAMADEKADRLHVIMKGQVRVTTRDGSFVTDLGPGDFFGEYSLIGDDRWGAEYGLEANYVCTTSVLCRTLTREVFDDLVTTYPPELEMELDDLEKRHTQRALAKQAARELRRSSSDPATKGEETPEDTPSIARWIQLVRRLKLQSRLPGGERHDLMRRAAQKITLQSASAWVRQKDELSRTGSPMLYRSRHGSIRSDSLGNIEALSLEKEFNSALGGMSSVTKYLDASPVNVSASNGSIVAEINVHNGLNGISNGGAVSSPMSTNSLNSRRHRGSISEEANVKPRKLQSSIDVSRRNSSEHQILDSLTQQVQVQGQEMREQAKVLSQLQQDVSLISHMLRTHVLKQTASECETTPAESANAVGNG
eukprot:CAMPEP_0184314466 /NCGR_PEP_ID=MMETSP1049-20130417/74367_1 /TAXON_ID=77928 /ORGANISM="Proteomonas sulcata, Strain CCMP704" /LENGTH=789 /DNA_ID=CAMNT_0026632391 /DNA_START=75 /DNA_END=2444 /DNA_ORIENTATION=-